MPTKWLYFGFPENLFAHHKDVPRPFCQFRYKTDLAQAVQQWYEIGGQTSQFTYIRSNLMTISDLLEQLVA
ncbi:Hypothetical predicted protein, partial [Paramuricea clavata]